MCIGQSCQGHLEVLLPKLMYTLELAVAPLEPQMSQKRRKIVPVYNRQYNAVLGQMDS